jgi:hypothetical protein
MMGMRNANNESAPAPPMRKKSRRGISGRHPQSSSQSNRLMGAIVFERVASGQNVLI